MLPVVAQVVGVAGPVVVVPEEPESPVVVGMVGLAGSKIERVECRGGILWTPRSAARVKSLRIAVQADVPPGCAPKW